MRHFHISNITETSLVLVKWTVLFLFQQHFCQIPKKILSFGVYLQRKQVNVICKVQSNQWSVKFSKAVFVGITLMSVTVSCVSLQSFSLLLQMFVTKIWFRWITRSQPLQLQWGACGEIPQTLEWNGVTCRGWSHKHLHLSLIFPQLYFLRNKAVNVLLHSAPVTVTLVLRSTSSEPFQHTHLISGSASTTIWFTHWSKKRK